MKQREEVRHAMEFDPQLVHEWLTRTAACLPQKIALVSDGRRWSYSELDVQSTRFAQHLVRIGVKRQDRVVIFLDNSAETVIALYGALKAGAVFVIAHSLLKAPKLAHVLGNSGAQVLVAHRERRAVVGEAVARLEAPCAVVWVGEPEAAATAKRADADGVGIPAGIDWVAMTAEPPAGSSRTLPRCIDADLACLIYTSGSTGQAKGVMSTHRSMVSAARSIIQYIGNTSDDVILNVLPLSFDYGLYQLIMTVMFGGTLVLEKSFVFLHPILQQVAKESVTGFPIVPTILAMLLKTKDLAQYDFRSLRYMTNTGAALPVEHIRRIRQVMPHVRLFSMFGLTECKRICFLPPEELDRRPGSVGKAMPNCETFVVDETGREVPAGAVGELVVRGSNVMSGYWRDPVTTARVYRRNEQTGEMFLHSGDYFRRDEDGFLYFLGRRDDLIKSRGERISAKEVENGLCELPGVLEAAVVAVPDEILGHAVKAFVVTDVAFGLTERDILKHCTASMEPWMVPKHVVLVDALPRTLNGKVDKKRLAAPEEGEQ